MSRREKEILERLGPTGLARVLDDLLDHTRLVRLANTCGLSYAGKHTRSQKRLRILADLVERAAGEPATRKTILKVLKKESAAAARTWASRSKEERDRLLRDDSYLERRGKLGLHLFLLASDGTDGGDETVLGGLLARCGPPPDSPLPENRKEESAMSSRETKKTAELNRKVKYLESQLRKVREAEKGLRRDLIERKGELAESRMLVERLRQEIAALEEKQGRKKKAAEPPHAETLSKQVESLTRALRKVAAGNRNLTHAVEKALESSETADQDLRPLAEDLTALRKESTSRKRERTRDREAVRARHDEMVAELKQLRDRIDETSPVPAVRNRKGGGDRVGVFVDVQNVYYGARQLKGKLDFDALLQAAVRDRRMILAKAYVVESKEIDQSGFIAMLQQRAIQVRRKTLKVRSDGSMKGDWDMEMALDILDAASGLDVVVLVSGDGDFTSLVNRVKTLGPRVEVLSFPRTAAKSLIEAADNFQPLDRRFMIRGEKDGATKPRRTKRPGG